MMFPMTWKLFPEALLLIPIPECCVPVVCVLDAVC
jgi:hypothetical protein